MANIGSWGTIDVIEGELFFQISPTHEGKVNSAIRHEMFS